MNNEIKLGDGIYFTDFRKNKKQTCFSQMQNNQDIQSKDVLSLTTQFNELQSKIQKLQSSIETIKQENDWNKDIIYVETIQENYDVISKYKLLQQKLLEFLQQKDPLNELCKQFSLIKLQQESDDFLNLRNNHQKQIKTQNDEDGIYL